MLQVQNEILAPVQNIARIHDEIGWFIDSCIGYLKTSKSSFEDPDEKGARSDLDEHKIVFLASFKEDVIVVETFNTQGVIFLLAKYVSEAQEIGLQIIEIALINFHKFQEDRLYTDDAKITQQQLFNEFQVQDINFLKVVLKSSLISDYVKQMKSLTNNKTSLYLIRSACESYFKQNLITKIKSKVTDILGYVLRSKQLVISDTYSYNPRIEILILIHLYFQQLLGHEGIVYQHSQRNNIVDFESEIFPIKFNNQWLTQSRLNFLTDESNWLLDTQTFTKQLSLKDLTWIGQYVNPIVKLMFHNSLLVIFIGQIQDILNDLAHLQIDKLQVKYHLKEPTQRQILTAEYTNLQYYSCLKDAIIRAINENKRLISLRLYHASNDQKLLTIFNFLIKSSDFNNVSLIQQTFLWIFQYEFNSSVEECGKICLTIMDRGSRSEMLSEEDQVMIQKIVESEGVKQVVLEINRIAGRISEDNDLKQEYLTLKNFLKNTPIIILKVDNLFGLSLINGRVAINESLLSLDPQTRAMKMITLIHEIYCHKKRKDFVSHNCVLEFTPDKMNAKQHLNKKWPCGELCFYFEYQIFGKIINGVNLKQAEYILDAQNWLKNPKTFMVGFSQATTVGIIEYFSKGKNRNQGAMLHKLPQSKQTQHLLQFRNWYKCIPREDDQM